MKTQNKELQLILLDIIEQATAHYDPLSSEGSTIDEYSISPSLYKRIVTLAMGFQQ